MARPNVNAFRAAVAAGTGSAQFPGVDMTGPMCAFRSNTVTDPDMNLTIGSFFSMAQHKFSVMVASMRQSGHMANELGAHLVVDIKCDDSANLMSVNNSPPSAPVVTSNQVLEPPTALTDFVGFLMDQFQGMAHRAHANGKCVCPMTMSASIQVAGYLSSNVNITISPPRPGARLFFNSSSDSDSDVLLSGDGESEGQNHPPVAGAMAMAVNEESDDPIIDDADTTARTNVEMTVAPHHAAGVGSSDTLETPVTHDINNRLVAGSPVDEAETPNGVEAPIEAEVSAFAAALAATRTSEPESNSSGVAVAANITASASNGATGQEQNGFQNVQNTQIAFYPVPPGTDFFQRYQTHRTS